MIEHNIVPLVYVQYSRGLPRQINLQEVSISLRENIHGGDRCNNPSYISQPDRP